MKKPNFAEIEKTFNSMSLRERVIMFFASLICITSISYFWMLDPIMLKQAKTEKVLALSLSKEKELKQEIANVELRLQQDPLQEINDKIAFSLQTLLVLDKQLDDKLVKFIHAQKMPLALSKVLSKSPGIKIESLISLPVEVFNADQPVVAKAGIQSIPNLFYKHTLAMKLVGDYNAVYRYLVNLENLPEKFYWSSLTYQVSEYPLAQVSVEIYTLSDQQDLISG